MLRLYLSLASCQSCVSVATSVRSMICLACHPSSTSAVSVGSLLGCSFTFMCFLPFQSRECPKLQIVLAKTTDKTCKIWYSALVLKMPISAGTIGTRLFEGQSLFSSNLVHWSSTHQQKLVVFCYECCCSCNSHPLPIHQTRSHSEKMNK